MTGLSNCSVLRIPFLHLLLSLSTAVLYSKGYSTVYISVRHHPGMVEKGTKFIQEYCTLSISFLFNAILWHTAVQYRTALYLSIYCSSDSRSGRSPGWLIVRATSVLERSWELGEAYEVDSARKHMQGRTSSPTCIALQMFKLNAQYSDEKPSIHACDVDT